MQKLMLYLHVHMRDLILTRSSQGRGDRGASILEYAALIILVGGVAVALMQLEVFNEIPTTVEESIQEVLNPG
ncbi:hypothetical protein ACFQZ2_04195 [Streptomonospora algeriensis]|uniref:Flp family type IVb pilin n=1 Tax=Streptomonospora algeriensis TaxID=995084 RepID=A0ABW3BBQ8_9ACTN